MPHPADARVPRIVLEWRPCPERLACRGDVEALLGWTGAEMGSRLEDWVAHAHPADRAPLWRAVGAAVRRGRLRLRIRMQHRSGHDVALEAVGRVVRVDATLPLALVIVVRGVAAPGRALKAARARASTHPSRAPMLAAASS